MAKFLKNKRIYAVLLLSVTLSACGVPVDISLTEKNPNGGVLIRSFAPVVKPTEAQQEGLRGGLETALGDSVPWRDSQYSPQGIMFYMNGSRIGLDAAFQWVEPSSAAPALGIQAGDLVEYYTQGAESFGFIDSDVPIAVRIVCKFYEDECIAANRRDYRCKDGAMLIDGQRREDKPCGGWGKNSDKYAAIIGPFDAYYTSFEDYLRQHDAPFDDCLITDMSCGHEKGMAIEKGKYGEFLDRFPNYEAALLYSHEYWSDPPHGQAFYELGDSPQKDWAIYLSHNMFNPAPVPYSEEQFLALAEDTRKMLASAAPVMPAVTTATQ